MDALSLFLCFAPPRRSTARRALQSLAHVIALASVLTAPVACRDTQDLPSGLKASQATPSLIPADYVVTTTADGGLGSLRQAIASANLATTATTIGFNIPSSDAGCSAGICTITLASTLPEVTTTFGLTIDGADQKITISGNNAVQAMTVASGAALTLRNLTVANSGNSSSIVGGGVFSSGALTVENSTFSHNTGSDGGAIVSRVNPLRVSGSTFEGNRAASDGIGGAILVVSGTANISNTTFTQNSAANVGGAIAGNGFAVINVVASTLTGNTGTGGGVAALQSSVTLSSTILNDPAPDCFTTQTGTITDGGYNLESGTSCGFSTAHHSMSSTSAGLDPTGLQDNGGPTKTIALLATSTAALDKIPVGTVGCEATGATDQRGYGRPVNGFCDIGAYEYGAVLPPSDHTAPTVTINTPADGSTFTLNQSVLADYTCADESGGSGLASCTGTVANGAAINTNTVGTHSFTVTGTDNAGNSNPVTTNYSVVYPFAGFVGQVSSQMLNIANAGSGVTIQFGLGGDQGLSVLAAGSPTSQPVVCPNGSPTDVVAPSTNSSGKSGLLYNATTQLYVYTWKTDKAWAGTCRLLTIALIDGTTHKASFQFK